MTVCGVAIGFLSSASDPRRGKTSSSMGISRFANSAPNRERGSAVAGKKAADDDSDAAKKFAFLAESNLVEAANTSSSASRRTRRARVMSGVCDYCSSAEALVCCRADSAEALLVVRRVGASVSLGKKASGALFRRSALGWTYSARGDRRARGLRARAGASARPSRLLDVFHSLCPVRHPEMTRKAARVAFSGPRVTSLTVAGARIFFPDRMALTADPSAPRRRCTARIRWRDDTSAPGYAIIVGARPEWCVPVIPSPPSRAQSFHLAAGARARR